MRYQDHEGLLDPPPLRLRDESLSLRVACDGLDVDAQEGAVGGDLVLKPWSTSAFSTVPPAFSATRLSRAMPTVLSGVLAARTVTAMTRQAQHVHGQAPLAARHPFRRVPAGRGGGDPGGRVNTLGVQHHQGRVL